jgi:hypothetical protein
VEKVVRVFDTFEEADAADALSHAQMTRSSGPAFFSNCESEPTPTLSRDLREFIECLNVNEVEYLIPADGQAVGALAVLSHGFPGSPQMSIS